MKVTYLGTTMLLFDDGKNQILFDCHVTRPGLITCILGTLQTNQTIADRVIHDTGMNHLRAIFVSHSHHDHVMDAPYFASRCHADIYGTASTANVARGGNISEEKIHTYRGGETYELGDYQITIIPSVHSVAHCYNNDLGQTIDRPLPQPAKKSAYKEGGSFDFLVEHSGKKYLIRPSYNYLEGQLNGLSADVLFLGITGLSKDKKVRKEKFFEETIDKVKPQLVVPLHWDHFFTPLYGEIKRLPRFTERTGGSLHELAWYCLTHEIGCAVIPPLAFLEL